MKKRTYYQRFVLDKIKEEEVKNGTNGRKLTYFERFAKY